MFNLLLKFRQVNKIFDKYNSLNNCRYYKSKGDRVLKNEMPNNSLSLKEVVEKLNEFAPEGLAEKWDNVGLLIEPYTKNTVKTIFLTNDLTENVLFEAIDKKANMIISYHPPIFASLKRITQNSWKERLVAICLEKQIAIYSPHTAWDSVNGGINDWLASCLPIMESNPITAPNLDMEQCGAGRFIKLSNELTLNDVINKFKTHLILNDVQVAVPNNSSSEHYQIKTVAICAGSGASLLKGITADLFITGEMSHHEVLDAIHNGSAVILTKHSNSERGFLKNFQKVFMSYLPNDVEIVVSSKDEDPLKTI